MIFDLLELNNDLMMFALIGLLFVWLFFRMSKRTATPRLRPQVSGRSTSWNNDTYMR